MNRTHSLDAAVPALVVVVMMAATSWVAPTRTVDRLTVVNDTPYQLNVEVGASEAGAGLDLGAVAPRASTPVADVVDQGPIWIFWFSYGGLGAGKVVARRSELARRGWRLTVPPEVAQHVRAHGYMPSSSP